MKHPLWERLPAELRSRVDELIAGDRKLLAIVAIRDTLDQPCPGIYECMDLLAERYAELDQPWFRPSPPLDIDVLARQAAALPHPPDARTDRVCRVGARASGDGGSLAVWVRRLHDTDRTGLWLPPSWIASVSLKAFTDLDSAHWPGAGHHPGDVRSPSFLELPQGNRGDNRFGPDPLGEDPRVAQVFDSPIIAKQGKQACDFRGALACAHTYAKRFHCEFIYTYDGSTRGNA
jgi:Protein of unknown function (DUF805)